MKEKILAIFGIRGTGKSTLRNKMVALYPNSFYTMRQVTTREIRENESKDEYDWLTPDEYFEIQDTLIATTMVNGNLYGTRTDNIDSKKIGITIVDIDGLNDLLNFEDKYEIFPIGLFNDTEITRKRNSDIYKYNENIEGYKNCKVLFLGSDEEPYIEPDVVMEELLVHEFVKL